MLIFPKALRLFVFPTPLMLCLLLFCANKQDSIGLRGFSRVGLSLIVLNPDLGLYELWELLAWGQWEDSRSCLTSHPERQTLMHAHASHVHSADPIKRLHMLHCAHHWKWKGLKKWVFFAFFFTVWWHLKEEWAKMCHPFNQANTH